MNKKELKSLGHLMVSVFIYQLSVFVVLPAITDVMVEALCPGQQLCSLAIYLTGFQQVIIGLGSLVATPLVGNLSDKYGRKTILTIPMIANIIPQAVMACGRSRNLVYAYWTIQTLARIICKGSIQSLTLAYVADIVAERRRASAFGVVSGVSSAGFVAGIGVARLVPNGAIFQVSAATGVVAAAYIRAFLVEPVVHVDAINDPTAPILAGSLGKDGSDRPREASSLMDMIRFVRSSSTFSQAAIIAFFGSFGESGLQESLLYFLKAKFLFGKDQFADIMLIIGIAGMFSQLVFTPTLAPAIGETRLLSLSLMASSVHIFLYSIAWAPWVPYLAALSVVASTCGQPCLRSIVSRHVRPSEQGMAQGCISGIASFASLLTPLLVTPLTALFLSDNAPFHFQGFSIMCIGIVSIAAFVQSIIMMWDDPQLSSCKTNISNQPPSTSN